MQIQFNKKSEGGLVPPLDFSGFIADRRKNEKMTQDPQSPKKYLGGTRGGPISSSSLCSALGWWSHSHSSSELR